MSSAAAADQDLELRLVEKLEPVLVDDAPQPLNKSFRLFPQSVVDVVFRDQADVPATLLKS